MGWVGEPEGFKGRKMAAQGAPLLWALALSLLGEPEGLRGRKVAAQEAPLLWALALGLLGTVAGCRSHCCFAGSDWPGDSKAPQWQGVP